MPDGSDSAASLYIARTVKRRNGSTGGVEMLFVCLGMFCRQRLGLEKDFPCAFFVRLFSSTRMNVETLGQAEGVS